jgi:acyl carrier protein
MEQKFIETLKEVLEIEDHEILMEDEFRNYEEWDSMAYLSVIAMLDEEYEFQVEEAEFIKMRTVKDLFYATQNK